MGQQCHLILKLHMIPKYVMLFQCSTPMLTLLANYNHYILFKTLLGLLLTGSLFSVVLQSMRWISIILRHGVVVNQALAKATMNA
jgi:hypothetical protein